MEIIYFISILCAVWLFAEGAASIDFIKETLNIHSGSKSGKMWLKVTSKLVNCCMCSGFWFGLAYYLDFWMACLVSVSAEVFNRLINRFLTKWQS